MRLTTSRNCSVPAGRMPDVGLSASPRFTASKLIRVPGMASPNPRLSGDVTVTSYSEFWYGPTEYGSDRATFEANLKPGPARSVSANSMPSRRLPSTSSVADRRQSSYPYSPAAILREASAAMAPFRRSILTQILAMYSASSTGLLDVGFVTVNHPPPVHRLVVCL